MTHNELREEMKKGANIDIDNESIMSKSISPNGYQSARWEDRCVVKALGAGKWYWLKSLAEQHEFLSKKNARSGRRKRANNQTNDDTKYENQRTE